MNHVQAMIDKFESAINKNGSSAAALTIDDFCELLGIFEARGWGEREARPKTATTTLSEHSRRRWLAFFDTDGSGSIEFREYAQAVALLSGKCSAEDELKLTFLLCDAVDDESGDVSIQEFDARLSRARMRAAEAVAWRGGQYEDTHTHSAERSVWSVRRE